MLKIFKKNKCSFALGLTNAPVAKTIYHLQRCIWICFSGRFGYNSYSGGATELDGENNPNTCSQINLVVVYNGMTDRGQWNVNWR